METIFPQDFLSHGGHDAGRQSRENHRMETRLRELRERGRPGLPQGYTLGQVAERIAEWFLANGIARGATISQVSKLERGETPLTDDWLNAFAAFYGVSVRELFPDKEGGEIRSAPLVGYVGAGEMYYPDPVAGPWAGFEEVEAPPGAVGVAAVRVRGDAMAPVYRDGDLLFYRVGDGLDPDRCVGKDCIVQLRGGQAYVKRVEKGPRGRLRLVSYGAAEPIDNPDIEWAAHVKWVVRSDG
jgi:transcriptional regulator with XRE-family HTH domain